MRTHPHRGRGRRRNVRGLKVRGRRVGADADEPCSVAPPVMLEGRVHVEFHDPVRHDGPVINRPARQLPEPTGRNGHRPRMTRGGRCQQGGDLDARRRRQRPGAPGDTQPLVRVRPAEDEGLRVVQRTDHTPHGHWWSTPGWPRLVEAFVTVLGGRPAPWPRYRAGSSRPARARNTPPCRPRRGWRQRCRLASLAAAEGRRSG
jgi:hypothetical protein